MASTEGGAARASRGARAALVHSGALEGSIALCVVLGTWALLALPPDLPLLFLAFCGTAAVYGFDRMASRQGEDAVNRPARASWWRRRGAVPVVFAAAGASALPTLEPATLAAGAALGGLSVLYVLPLLPGGRRLKEYGLAKPLAISAGWGLGAVAMPLLEAGATFSVAASVLMLVRTLTVFANALLTDWPDRHGDVRTGLATPAVRWPWPRLQRRALGVLAAAGGLEGLLLLHASPSLVLIDAAGVVAMLLLAARLDPAHPRYGRLLDLVVAWPLVTALAAAA